MRKFLVQYLVALCAVCCATTALAERNFPQKATRGDMTAFKYPYMKIGDKSLRMSAGSRIFNERNFIIMPASLQKQTAPVMFITDMRGELSEIWLLTAEEAKKHPAPKGIAPVPGGQPSQ
jgi:hypothetical protein